MTNRGKRKIGRNDPCPCGSGEKYKRCHGRLTVPPLGPSAGQIEAVMETLEAPHCDQADKDCRPVHNMRRLAHSLGYPESRLRVSIGAFFDTRIVRRTTAKSGGDLPAAS